MKQEPRDRTTLRVMRMLSSMLCLLVVFPLACDRTPPAAPARETVHVTATAYALSNVAAVVGGDRVEPDWLFELGDPPSPATISESERSKLQAGWMVIGSGTRNEPWLTRDLTEGLQTSKLLLLEELPIARTTPDRGLLWLDPFVARDAAKALAGRLTVRFSEERATFEKNAAAFEAALNALLARYPNSAFAGKTVVIVGPDFVPFLDRFGVRRVVYDGRPLRLSAADLTALRRTAGSATTILLPADTPAGARRRIEDQTGLRAVLIDPLGASGAAGRATYLALLEFNLTQLRQATAR